MPRQRQRSVQSMVSDSMPPDAVEGPRSLPPMPGRNPPPSPLNSLPGGQPTPNPPPPSDLVDLMPHEMSRPNSMGGPPMFDSPGPPPAGPGGMGPIPPLASLAGMGGPGPRPPMQGQMMGGGGGGGMGYPMMDNKGPGMPPGPMMPQSGPSKIYPPNQPMVFNPSNPNAPPIYPCGYCHREVHDNDQAILCESGCNFWFHRPCTGLAETAYLLLTKEIYAEWACDKCIHNKNIPLIKLKP